jgi:hypothetical protein
MRSCFWGLIVSGGEKREGEEDGHGVFKDGFCGTAGGVVVGVYLDHQLVEVLNCTFELFCDRC